MRAIGRALRIGSGALFLCALWLRCRWGRPSTQEARLRTFGRRVAHLLEWLGPSFIKIGQLFSTRADLLPRGIILELARLQDNVRPTSTRRMLHWWRKIAPAELQKEYPLLDPVPLAAGSVSQVHLARTQKGDTIAVKIQRPELAELIKADLSVLRYLGRLMRRFKALCNVPILDAIEEVGRALQGQLDFVRERSTLELYRDLLADCDDITFPKTYAFWSNEYVLAQEPLVGLVRLDDSRLSESTFRYCGELLLHTIYKMIFVGGIVHCDLHPANVFVSHGKLVVLDAGFSVRLDSATKAEFSRFFRALAFGEARVCAEIMLRTASSRSAAFDLEGFYSDVDAIIKVNSGKRACDFSVSRFAFHLFDCQRKRGLVASSQFIMTVWSLLVVEGIIRQRWPEVDFQSKAVTYLTGSILRDLAV